MTMIKLMLNDETKVFFENENQQLWDLIIANDIDQLKAILPREDAENEKFDLIMKELISEGKSQLLESFDFVTITEGNSLLLRNLIRLIVALDINGEYEEWRQLVGQKLFDCIPQIAQKIKQEANGYPKNPISGLVWSEASGMRSGLNAFIYYYKLRDGSDEILHFLIMNRTQITLAIMGHYKNLVGPDMIESARIKEKMGQQDVAHGFYEAVKDDFIDELDWFKESPEHGPNEDDVVTLQSLKEALQSLDRLNNTSAFGNECAIIEEILSREYQEIDFDEEDEE